MIRAGLPYIAGFTVAILGTVVFTTFEWPGFTLYLVLFAAIVVYFTVLDFVDGHPRQRTRRP